MAEHLPWTALVGGPNCGKTTTINSLEQAGFRTLGEPARELLSLPEVDVDELKSNFLRMQESIAAYAVYLHTRVHNQDLRDGLQGIHRFTDGTALDTKAYLRAEGIQPSAFLDEIYRQHSAYKQVFLLEPTPYEDDGVRPNEAFSRKVHEYTAEVYLEEGCEIVEVPLMSVDDRVSFILEQSKAYGSYTGRQLNL